MLALEFVRMRSVVRVLALGLVVTSGCDGSPPAPLCTDGVKQVSVDRALDSLDGESPKERFERASIPWNCSVTWLALPEALATQTPAPGTSPLELTLERTSDEARYREYAQTPGEKWEGSGCQTDAVFVPCSLGLVSDDGALDEMLECELRLQGDNTYVYLVLPSYEFAGEHTFAFVGDVSRDSVELGVTYTPGSVPARIDGSIVESGTRVGRGQDPLVTTALLECLPL